jgi:hypothetical protein
MKRKHLLRLSSFFALFTFAAHTLGALSDHSKGDAALEATYKMMQESYIQFPMGVSRNIVTLMLGANLCLSVYLFISGMLFILLANKPSETWRQDNPIILLNTAGLLVTAIISAFYFFSMPALFLGLAALAGFTATRVRA